MRRIITRYLSALIFAALFLSVQALAIEPKVTEIRDGSISTIHVKATGGTENSYRLDLTRMSCDGIECLGRLA